MKRVSYYIVPIIFWLFACNSPGNKTAVSDTSKAVIKADTTLYKVKPDDNFAATIYLKIDKVYTGPVFTEADGSNNFYRVLEIPEEENISLYAEKISIGEEGGAYKLQKRYRLTDDNSALPKFGLSSVNELSFKDSVSISGLFNSKIQVIDLQKLKPLK